MEKFFNANNNVEAKKLYRLLSIKYHPDRNTNKINADKEFKILGAIYDILKKKYKII